MQKIKLPAMAAMVATGLVSPSLAPEGVVASLPSVAATTDEGAVHSGAPLSMNALEGENTVQSRTVSMVFPAETHWSRTKERRFKELAVQEALNQLSPSGREELRSLDSLRERELSPPSGEEALRQYRARQVTANLLLALSEYVTFFGHAPDSFASASYHTAD